MRSASALPARAESSGACGWAPFSKGPVGAPPAHVRQHAFDYCRWQLAGAGKRSVLHLKPQNTARRAATLRAPSGHRASALAAHSAAPAPLLLLATSDHSLHILDATRRAPVATATAAHPRAISQIALLPASPLSPMTGAAHNAALSADRGGLVQLWDLRTLRAVRRFTAAEAGNVPLGAALAPCGGIVAAGCASGGGAVLLFDVRGGGPLARVPLVRSGLLTNVDVSSAHGNACDHAGCCQATAVLL